MPGSICYIARQRVQPRHEPREWLPFGPLDLRRRAAWDRYETDSPILGCSLPSLTLQDAPTIRLADIAALQGFEREALSQLSDLVVHAAPRAGGKQPRYSLHGLLPCGNTPPTEDYMTVIRDNARRLNNG